MVLVPSSSISWLICCDEPLPTASSRMTAATPIITPSSVRAERSLLAVTPRKRGAQHLEDAHAATAASVSERMRPSRTWMTRRACAATFSSWVITTIVRPCADEAVEHAEHLVGRLGVEVAGGLIREQDRRRRHESAGDRDALLLTAGELLRLVVDAVGESDELERREGAGAALGAADPRVEQRKLDVGERRHPRDQVERLEHEPDLPVAQRGRARPRSACARPVRRAGTARRRRRRGSRAGS